MPKMVQSERLPFADDGGGGPIRGAMAVGAIMVSVAC
jgi:hypothetical protein